MKEDLRNFYINTFQGDKTPAEKEAILRAEFARLERSMQATNEIIGNNYVYFVEILKTMPVGQVRALCRSTRLVWEELGLWDDLMNRLKLHFHESNRAKYHHNPADPKPSIL